MLTEWKIKINETISTQVMFTLRKNQCPPIFFNNILIPESPSVRYLGMHIDEKLTSERKHGEKEKTNCPKVQTAILSLRQKITIIPGKTKS